MLGIILSLGLIGLGVTFAVFIRAYWKFFHLTNEHRRKLEMVIVEIVKRLPFEELEQGVNEESIQNMLYNCRFRKHGRAYHHEVGIRHRKMPFWEFIKVGIPAEDNYPALFLKDGLDGSYRWDYAAFLESIGIEAPGWLERDNAETIASNT